MADPTATGWSADRAKERLAGLVSLARAKALGFGDKATRLLETTEPSRSVIENARVLAAAMPGWVREFKNDPAGTVGGTLVEAGRAQLGLPGRTPEYAAAPSSERVAADFDFWASNPEAGLAAGQLAMPLAVHASPNKWAGKPLDSARGTGEGGAAYGEGHYATVPSNAKGIDARYREGAAEYKRPVVRLDGFDLDEMAMNPILKERLLAEFPKQVAPGAKIDAEGALMMARVKLEDKIRFANREAEKFHKMGATDAVGEYLNLASDYRDALESLSKLTPDRFSTASTGSFHVWDVPDTLLDYDAPLAKQPTLKAAGVEVEGGHGVDSIYYQGEDLGSVDGRPASGKDLVEGLEIKSRRAGGEGGAGDFLTDHGIGGHTYAGEAGSARTSGIEGDVPNFVIYRGDDITPLGTFGSAEEWLASDLRKRLQPRIDAEDALRKAGQATPEAYAKIRAMFGGNP